MKKGLLIIGVLLIILGAILQSPSEDTAVINKYGVNISSLPHGAEEVISYKTYTAKEGSDDIKDLGISTYEDNAGEALVIVGSSLLAISIGLFLKWF